ncbi:hypothetical protein V502_00347 [Pseudogymnoascus sp. VKM F-4520 (FW-2644)]|nr:hypothetical protein V502_00347 [Pseudogymnoascus sp. VKM F-4520 (FW-2644)]
MFDTAGKIAIAQLAFFIIAIFPALYCLFKHGQHGLLGWVSLCVFCIIRIVGAAIIVSDESTNKTVSEAGLIIASVAIAPMIISVGGVAHESYISIKSHRHIIFGFIPHVVIHFGCVAAIAMIALGYTKFEKIASTTSDMKTGLDMVRAGGILLLAVWLSIGVIVAVSCLYPRDLRGEKQLIRGVVVAMFVLVVRILYTTSIAFINTASFNLRTGGTITEKVVLDVLPEFIFTFALLAAGIASRNLKYEREMK